MKMVSKEAYGKDIKVKMLSIGNIFLTKREVSAHDEAVKSIIFTDETVKSIIFTDEAFKYRCSVCFYWSKKE